jgi:hypothetical protein
MPPAAAAAAPLVLGAVGAGTAAALGVGKSKFTPQNFGQAGNYDKNRFNYGGREGGAQEAANRYGAIGQTYTNNSGMLLGQGMQDRERALGARAGQVGMADAMANRARGNNLISTRVAEAARRKMGAQTQSNIASARGPAGIALAGQDATAAGAQGLASISDSETTQSIGEQMANEQAAMQAYTGIRGGDYAGAGQAFDASGTQGALGSQYAGHERGVQQDQLNANVAQQRILAGSEEQAQQINAQTQSANAARDMEYLKMFLGGAQSGMPTPGPAPAGGGGGGGGAGAAGGSVATSSTGGAAGSSMSGNYPNVSDPLAKMGVSPMSGPGAASFDVLNGGGMDVGASLEAHSNFGTQFQANPGAQPSMSDPKVKTGIVPADDFARDRARFDEVHDTHRGRRRLGPPPKSSNGLLAHVAAQREGDDAADHKRRTLTVRGPAGSIDRHGEPVDDDTHFDIDAARARGESYSKVDPKSWRSADELMREADDLERSMQANLDRGPSTGPNRHVDGRDRMMRDADARIAELDRALGNAPAASPANIVRENPYGEAPTDIDLDRDEPAPWLAQYMDGQGPMAQASDPKAKAEAFQLGMDMGQAKAEQKTMMAQPGWKPLPAGPHEGERVQDGRSPETAAQSKENGFKQYIRERIAPNHTAPTISAPREEPPSNPDYLPKGELPGGARLLKRGATAVFQQLMGPVVGTMSTNYLTAREKAQREELKANPQLRYEAPASDPRAKAQAEKLGGPHVNEVAQTLDAVPAVSYKYKSPEYEPNAQRPGERQVGFLTTDLKKTPMGASVVEKRPDGLEGYNEHRLNGLQHAEIRNLHERLRELEALIAKGA